MFTMQLSKFDHLSVLVVGDIMLDRFIYGVVERLSPESPAPLLTVKDMRSMLGGVGNVVRNLSALGASCTLHTVVGDDAIGREVITLVGQEQGVTGNVVTEQGRPTTMKVRYVADGQQLLRADNDTRHPIKHESSRRILASMCVDFSAHDVIVLSDYKKGVFSTDLLRLIINLARENGKPVIIDPKARDLNDYRGATVITPNISELRGLALLSNCPVTDFDDDEDILEAGLWLAKEYNIENILVTRGKDGMTLICQGGGYKHIGARAHEVFDVSGAGDTVVATMALALATKMSPFHAADLANIAAGIAVERVGTSIVSQLDLEMALLVDRRVGGIQKIMGIDAARDLVSKWKRASKTVGFTNGCFDLLHSGHLQLLTAAREKCDRLIVAVNSDQSVRRLKGEGRPIQNQYERARILASMTDVDLVVIFDADTPLGTIHDLMPEILFKGSDYTQAAVVGAEVVENAGGQVIILPRTMDTSTGAIIKKVQGIKPELVVNNHGEAL